MAEEEKSNWLVQTLWDSTTGFFINMWKDAWSGFVNYIDQITAKFAKGITDWMAVTEKDQWGAMLDLFKGAGLLDDNSAQNLMKWKDLPTPVDQFMFLKTLFSLSSAYVDLNIYGASAEMRRAIASKYTPERPSPEAMVSSAFIAPEKTQEVRDKMKELGFDDNDIDLMFLARYRLYSEETVMTLYLRGVLDENQMFMRMRELGYTDTRIKEMIQSWSLIPGPSDLLHMVAKEAFEPDAIKLMGLEDEFPGDQVEWLTKQGLSEFWAKKYWAAHWEMPSIQMGYEMYHRQDPERPGQTVINKEELDMLFRTVEIPPYWRDKLTKIAYMPYTRVDVRRMHKMGVLTDEELVWAYKDQGYDEEHALKMAEFTVRYNQQHGKDLTRGQIMTGFKEKIVSREDTIEFLQGLGYSEEEAEYLVILEEYKETKDYQDDLIRNIKERFQNNLLTEFETQSQLNNLNLPATRVATLMDRWKIHKMVDVKVPSKTDMEKFLKNKIISVDEYRIEMDKLGYNTKYTEWFEKLASVK